MLFHLLLPFLAARHAAAHRRHGSLARARRAIALVIVSTARAEPPQVNIAATQPYGQLSRAAPIAVTGCGLSGLVSSTFYLLVPAWVQGEGIERATIALFMLVAVLGGLAFQIPVGRFSDRFDRLIVLAALSLGFAAAAIALVVPPHSLPAVLIAAALLGGFMSTLDPVCVADAHDRMPGDRVVAVSSCLILASGIGSVLGLGASIMACFDVDGVLYTSWLLRYSSWRRWQGREARLQRRRSTWNDPSISCLHNQRRFRMIYSVRPAKLRVPRSGQATDLHVEIGQKYVSLLRYDNIALEGKRSLQ